AVMPEWAGPPLARAALDLDLQMDGVRVVRVTPLLMRGTEDRHHGDAERLREVSRARVGRHQHFGRADGRLGEADARAKVRQADDAFAGGEVDDLACLLPLG